MRAARTSTAVLLVATLVLTMAPAASAEHNFHNPPWITSLPSSGPPGTVVRVNGGEFSVGRPIEIRWFTSPPSGEGELLTSTSGPTFSVDVVVPSAVPGTYTLVALQRLASGALDHFSSTRFLVEPPPAAQGYWLTASDGGIFAFGDAEFFGSTGGLPLNKPVVGMAPTPTGGGYWLTASDGGIFSFGDAPFHGSTGAFPLNQPIVAMAATPTGGGYWLTAADGGIFAFGDASFLGSTGGTPPTQPIVGMAAAATGSGYWLVAADGMVFPFGDAGALPAAAAPQSPVVGIAAGPAGGYWLTASNGAVVARGDVGFFGSMSGFPLTRPIVGLASTGSGDGYWLTASDGGIFSFGDAGFFGSTGAMPLNQPIVGMASTSSGG